MNSIGFAVRFPWTARRTSIPSGARQSKNTTTLVHLLVRMEFKRMLRSVIFLQIRPVVHACNLIAVAVEHQRRAPQEFPDAPLFRLAPPRMIHVGVYIRIESIFMLVGNVPGSGRLVLHKPDFHQRLRALEAVLP